MSDENLEIKTQQAIDSHRHTLEAIIANREQVIERLNQIAEGLPHKGIEKQVERLDREVSEFRLLVTKENQKGFSDLAALKATVDQLERRSWQVGLGLLGGTISFAVSLFLLLLRFYK